MHINEITMNKQLNHKKQTTEDGLGLFVHELDQYVASQPWIKSSIQPYIDEINSFELLPHQFLSVFTQDHLVFILFDESDVRWCVGPMLSQSVDKVQKRLHLTNFEMLQQLRQVKSSQVKAIGSLLMSYWKDSQIEVEQVILGEIEAYEHQSTNIGLHHTQFSEELNKQILNIMISGNVEEMKAFVKLFDQMSWDHMIQGNPLRSIKNTVITSISRYGFVAMNEGLDYVSMMKEADEFIHRVEAMDSNQACVTCLKDAALRFTHLIHEFKHGQYSKYTKYVLKKIKVDFNQNLSLAGLAIELNISSSHLSRIISFETQQSFHDLLNSERIERAKEYLRQPQNNVASTAQLCGFLYQNHFTQVFKKHTGMTPKEYLKIMSPVLIPRSAT
jgi:YesN/AraC family two-component response regulator